MHGRRLPRASSQEGIGKHPLPHYCPLPGRSGRGNALTSSLTGGQRLLGAEAPGAMWEPIPGLPCRTGPPRDGTAPWEGFVLTWDDGRVPQGMENSALDLGFSQEIPPLLPLTLPRGGREGLTQPSCRGTEEGEVARRKTAKATGAPGSGGRGQSPLPTLGLLG